ncbi:MAG: Crp/Fnr family transcriptional regulator [Bacteroidia bacterium]
MENELFAFISRYLSLDAAERQAILDLGVFRQYPKDHLLLRAGAWSHDYYFVLKGCLRAYALADGVERTFNFFTEGQSYTPPCAAGHMASDHYLVCVEDALLVVADATQEAALFRRFPRFETLCRRFTEDLLVQQQVSFDRFRHATPAERYQDLLRQRPDLVQRVPQHQLASYLGIQPETLSRIRRRLADQARALS